MEGLKEQLRRVKRYEEELESMAGEVGFGEKASENDMGEFLKWTRETDKPYRLVNDYFNREQMRLWNSVQTITGNAKIGDYLWKGDYQRAEREIEAAYRLTDEKLGEVLN